MQLQIPAATLIGGLRAVKGAIERRNTIAILSHVLMDAKDGALFLKATDLDIEVSMSVPAEVQTAGTTTVEAETLSAFVGKLPKGANVKLEATDADLKVSSSRSRCALHTLPATDFPDLMATGEFTNEFELAVADLNTLFKRVQFAISTEETRYYLNGVYLHAKDGELISAATDGHRLAKVSMAAPENVGKTFGVIVPRKTVTEALKLSDGGDAAIKVSLSSTKVRFACGGTTLVSKLIDATYPDYDRVIPKENTKVLVLNKTELTSCVDRAVTVATEKSSGVKLSISDKLLTVNMKSPAGETTEEMEITSDFEPLDIGFNARYLLDLLAEIHGKEVMVSFGDTGSPALFQEVPNDGFIGVCMPIRIMVSSTG